MNSTTLVLEFKRFPEHKPTEGTTVMVVRPHDYYRRYIVGPLVVLEDGEYYVKHSYSEGGTILDGFLWAEMPSEVQTDD